MPLSRSKLYHKRACFNKVDGVKGFPVKAQNSIINGHLFNKVDVEKGCACQGQTGVIKLLKMPLLVQVVS